MDGGTGNQANTASWGWLELWWTSRNLKHSDVIYCIMAETKVSDEISKPSLKKGNGILRREVWVDGQGKVTRYNLSYINHMIFHDDNGRVVGYDNAHGSHHRHFMGKVEPIKFKNFEDIEDRFLADWIAIRSTK